MSASVVSVNVVHEVVPGYYGDTAIDKRPGTGPVQVDELGLTGDRQLNGSHGGSDKAVYVYAEEDAATWARDLGRDVPPGLFGENLTVAGLDVTEALIGEQWAVGDDGLLLEVRLPRTPCKNLSLRLGVDGFHQRFNASGQVGALCRVLRTGTVRPGAAIEVTQRPDHLLTVADLATGRLDPVVLQQLLACDVPLARSVRAKARRIVDRAAAD